MGALYQRYSEAQAVLECNPNNIGVFHKASWIPNVLLDNGIEAQNGLDGILKVAHCPSHRMYKNVDEMQLLMKQLPDIEYNLIKIPERDRFLNVMSKNHLLFDNVWQGYFGMVSLEAMQMGIVPMARVTQLSYEAFCEKLGCDEIPLIRLESIYDILDAIKFYDKNRDALKEKSEEVKKWIKTYYNEKRIVKMWEEFYNGLIQTS